MLMCVVCIHTDRERERVSDEIHTYSELQDDRNTHSYPLFSSCPFVINIYIFVELRKQKWKNKQSTQKQEEIKRKKIVAGRGESPSK